MNAHTMTRGFIGMIAIGACALALTILPGVSEARGDAHASSSAQSTKGPGTKNVDASCMAKAIDEREDAAVASPYVEVPRLAWDGAFAGERWVREVEDERGDPGLARVLLA